jgi:hypothetical protein
MPSGINHAPTKGNIARIKVFYSGKTGSLVDAMFVLR